MVTDAVGKALENSRHFKTAAGRRILRANKNLAERIELEGLAVDYSREDDYVRIAIGAPRPSISVSMPDEPYAVLMIDPDTFNINAIEAPFFMEGMKAAKSKGEFWRVVATLIEEGRTSVYIPPREQRERTERALRELALA